MVNYADAPDSIACKVEAFWSQFFGFASVSWNAVICVNLVINLKNPFTNTQAREKFYHLYVWGVAFITSIVLVMTNLQKSSGDGTCWLNGHDKIGWAIFQSFLILYIIISLSTFIFAVLRINYLDGAEEFRKRVLLRMAMYVLIFMLSWSGPLANKFYQLLTDPNDCTQLRNYLELWDSIGVAAQGLANSFVWFTNPTFFLLLKSKLVRKKGDNNESSRLLPGQQYLEDKRYDFNRLTLVLRKNTLTCILLGIIQAVTLSQTSSDNKSDWDSKQKICKKSLRYEFKALDLALDEISGSFTKGSVDIFTSRVYYFIDKSPQAFSRIRALYGISDENYMKALNPKHFLRAMNDKFTDGRSGSFFCFSPDRNLILKTIPKEESQLLKKILPHYLSHLEEYPDSLLTKFLGSYAIKVPHGESTYILVMQNVFGDSIKMHEVYDLKGSWVDRGGNLLPGAGDIGKDMDLKQKIHLREKDRAELFSQIQKDTLVSI